MSKNEGGSWGALVNLGPIINTPGHEMYPTFGPNGKLYFSSTGHPGTIGGWDILHQWKAPVGQHQAICVHH